MGQCNTELLFTLIINIHTITTFVSHSADMLTLLQSSHAPLNLTHTYTQSKTHTQGLTHEDTVNLHHTRGSASY